MFITFMFETCIMFTNLYKHPKDEQSLECFKLSVEMLLIRKTVLKSHNIVQMGGYILIKIIENGKSMLEGC